MSYFYSYNLGAFLLLILTLQILPVFPTTTKLSLNLIHRRSILSHYYSKQNDDEISAPVTAAKDHLTFMVNISIGQPPVPLLMAMDTGSSVTWVRCGRCDNGCNNVFDPKKSSTFSLLSRDAPQCSSFVRQNEKSPLCVYNLTYVDQSSSAGYLALERFTFTTSTEGTLRVSDVVVGCSYTTPPGLQGMLGLGGPTMYHLVARTGNKFSYCIGNISDDQYMYGRLILGDGAIIQGDSTPFRFNKYGHYIMSLQGISVGEKYVVVNQQGFEYNVLIDSGATRTHLMKDVYEVVVAEVKKLLDGVLEPIEAIDDESEVCYLGDLERDLKGFPIVTFHLAEGTDVDLDVEGLFQRSPDGRAFCIAIDKSGWNIIGVMAQQYYNVGYDLNAKRISFQRIDCELLLD